MFVSSQNRINYTSADGEDPTAMPPELWAVITFFEVQFFSDQASDMQSIT